jgi:hypothetical protein
MAGTPAPRQAHFTPLALRGSLRSVRDITNRRGPRTCLPGRRVLGGRDPGSWRLLRAQDTREAALAELEHVFALIAQEDLDRGVALPKDTTEIVHA